MKKDGPLFSLFRQVTASLTMGSLAVLSTYAGTAASAAAPKQTTVKMLAPNAISYADRQTTIAGTLLTTEPSGGSHGVGGEPVSIDLLASDRKTVIAELGAATSAADGSFSLTATVPGPGYVRASFSGDGAYAAAAGLAFVQGGSWLPSRVQLDPLPAAVDQNADFTISGQVQVEAPDGSWTPASGTQVKALPTGALTYANRDGRFSFTVNESAPRDWQIWVLRGMGSFADDTNTTNQFVNVHPLASHITSFSVRSNGVAQQGLTFTVHADVESGGQWKPYGGALKLYFRPEGSSTWRESYATGSFNGADQTLSGAGMSTSIPPATAGGKSSSVSQNGTWRVEVPSIASVRGQTGVVSSHSGEIPTLLQPYGTSVRDMRTAASGKSRYVRAWLSEPCDWPPSAADNGCGMVPHQPVKLYFRYRTGKAWHYVTTTKTDGNGTLSVKATGTKRYYRLVYSGSTAYAGTTSSQIYLSS